MAIEKILEATSSIPYKTIFLVLMGAKYLFENYLKLRQYRRVSSDRPIPKELKELNIEEKQFKSSNKYTKAKMEFGFVSELFSVALEIIDSIFSAKTVSRLYAKTSIFLFSNRSLKEYFTA